MDLQNELMDKSRLLDNSIKMLRKTGSDYAKAYTDYRVALAKELLKLKDEGYAITLAVDIARGNPEIAHLKFEEISKECDLNESAKVKSQINSNQSADNTKNDDNIIDIENGHVTVDKPVNGACCTQNCIII